MHTSNQLSSILNVRHGFFGRDGGVSKGDFASLNTSLTVGDDESNVLENRRRVCVHLNAPSENLFVPKQVHGDMIILVTHASDPKEVESFEADAIWTTDPGLVVGVQTADCAPLLLADKNGRGVMAVHLGWRGAANGLAQKAVRVFCKELEISPSDVVAAIGPCIGFENFEVGPEVVEALRAQVSPVRLVREKGNDKYHVDLEGWIERQLEAVGVTTIDKLGQCTVENATQLFSFRRDKGHTGRQIAAIVRKR